MNGLHKRITGDKVTSIVGACVALATTIVSGYVPEAHQELGLQVIAFASAIALILSGDKSATD